MIVLFNKLFESREYAHALHLSSKEYSKHVALQEYYEAIVPLLDSFIETYQGQFGLVDLSDIFEVKTKFDLSNTLKYFKELVDVVTVEKNKNINKINTHLLSIIDEITCLIYRIIYKLTYLK